MNHSNKKTSDKLNDQRYSPQLTKLKIDFSPVLRKPAQMIPAKPHNFPMRICDSPRIWFELFDFNNDEILFKESIFRGLCETFNLSESDERAILRQEFDQIWDEVDVDFSGSIDKSDFLAVGGMAEKLIIMEEKRNITKAENSLEEVKYRSKLNEQSQENKQLPQEKKSKNSDKKLKKIKIPEGMEPGQHLKYNSASKKKIFTFMIPERRKWKQDEDEIFYFNAFI